MVVVRLAERRGELRVARGALARAAAGAGGVLQVEGSAGVGKTALLDAVRGRALDADFQVLFASGGELEQVLPYGVVRQLLEPVARRFRAGDDAVFAGTAGLVRQVLDASVERAGDGPAVGAAAYGFYWVCSNLCDQAPLLVMVDDAHWADDPSMRLMSHIVDTLDNRTTTFRRPSVRQRLSTSSLRSHIRWRSALPSILWWRFRSRRSMGHARRHVRPDGRAGRHVFPIRRFRRM